ncbi:MAG: RcnB family protein [Pseudomonadota bacterium]|uniref:RcnB family protein n=1 Tax=Sphingobium naphthae TaxID=1886786 RepID=UPI002B06BD40|nr:RcnB family protein [Pseudomonadota bacterium]
MFKKMMLAGLMGATVLSGIAPAYAQERPARSERATRGGGDMAVSRGNRMTQPRYDGARAQRPAERPRQMTPARPDNRLRGEPARALEQARNRRDQAQARRDDPRADRPQTRNDWREARPDARDDRRDWRTDRRDDRQDRLDDRRDDRGDWRTDRRDDRREWRDDRRDARRDNGRDWADGHRYDDRTRWSSQRRWDNGWRQDRRYDWRSYRSRYGDRYRIGRYYAPRGWSYGYRSFSAGIFLSNILYANNYWISDPYAYRLPPAYGTLRWVRYYDDALLVDIRDGYVVDVIHDFFW